MNDSYINNCIVLQEIISLSPKSRGFHLITKELLKKSKILNEQRITGILHVLLMHTSASLTLNENADQSVRHDFETFTSHLIPENFTHFIHTYEGSDDMPAHIKSALYGVSLTIPVKNSNFLLGTWQGIYLNEHRNHGGTRRIALTAIGHV